MAQETGTDEDRNAKKLLESMEQLQKSVIELKDGHFAALAGPFAERIMRDREEAKAYLTYPDSRVRRAAIIAIIDHWGSSPEFEEYCITTLLEEHDLDLRATALSALSKAYQGTANERVVQLLRTLLNDKTCPEKLGALAYLAFFRVSGKQVDKKIRSNILHGTFCFPRDIDFSLME
jgi:HEAT repeat protein